MAPGTRRKSGQKNSTLDPLTPGLRWATITRRVSRMETYNQNEDAARAFLTDSNAKPVVIPYRANRAVIFDSSLFHETDTISFKDGYLNRRIGLTLLFGKRESVRICP